MNKKACYILNKPQTIFYGCAYKDNEKTSFYKSTM